MSEEKHRISSFAFSKEIFSDSTFSSFLFENDLMNFDLDKDKKTEPTSTNTRTESTSTQQNNNYSSQQNTSFSSSIQSNNYSSQSQNNNYTSPRLSSKLSSPKLSSPRLSSKRSSPGLSSPKHSPSQKSIGQTQYHYQTPSKIDVNYSKETQSQPLSATVYNTNSYNYNQNAMGGQRSFKNGTSSSTYHLSSPVSAPPVENSYNSYRQLPSQSTTNETSETANYYNIINHIKRENLNNINNSSKSLHTGNSTFSMPSSPPISPLPVNINNQKFYKATQASHSAVDLSRTDPYYDEIRPSKTTKEYNTSGSNSSSYVKPRSKSINNNSVPFYEEDSYDYLNDSITDFSFTQKENYEGSVTTNGSENKEKKGHSRSLSKSLKRAVSRNTKKNKKDHHKNTSLSDRSNTGSYSSSVKQNDLGQYHEFTDSSLVFKPSNGAISSYGDLSRDKSFDFDSLISSDQTRKITLTPNRMNEIQKHNTPSNRLKPKNHERENLVPMTVINGTLGRSKGNNSNNMNTSFNSLDDYDSDDSIDRLLNDGKPKKKQETLWEFLKNSDPEDFIGNGKGKSSGKKNPPPPLKTNNSQPQAKYIPIKIQYSPFDNENNNNNSSNNNTNINNNNNNNNSNNSNPNTTSTGKGYVNNTNKPKITNIPPTHPISGKKPIMNDMKQNPNYVNASLPIQQRISSKNPKIPAPPPHGMPKPNLSPINTNNNNSNNINNNNTNNNNQSTNSMKLAQTISILAKSPELYDDENALQSPSVQSPIYPPEGVYDLEKSKSKPKPKPRPKMVSTGTQYYISDAALLRKKRVIFRPVDRRNPIAKYMFNHSFIETIYVSDNDINKRKRIVPDRVPVDFLARNIFYYAKNPSAVPVIPEEYQWDYPERDSNPIAKYMFLVQENDYPWRDTNPIAKYMFNEWAKKDTCPIVINSEYLPEIVEEKEEEEIQKEEEIQEKQEEETVEKEIEIIDDALVETVSTCGSEEINIEKTTEVIKIDSDEIDTQIESVNNEDKTEINDEMTLSTNNVKKTDIENVIHDLYTQKEKEEIVNLLFGKVISYLEEKEKEEKEEQKQKENSKKQEFAKLMFDENTKLRKELSKIRSELSAERVLRERAEEELERYQSLMESTLLNN